MNLNTNRMKQIKIKGKRVYKKALVRNIVNNYSSANINVVREGLSWYADAHNLCENLANKYGTSASKVAGIIAALSPLTSWERNKEIAELFLKGQRKGLHTNRMIAKAEAVLACGSWYDIPDILNGDKIRSFFFNIYSPFSSSQKYVTIDRHAISVAYGREINDKDRPQLTKNQYNFISDAYMLAAKEISANLNVLILSFEVQAITWVNFRINKQIIN